MPDVRLDRTHQQRPVRLTRTAIGRGGRLHLDRVAQRGTGAMRFQVVDIAPDQTGARQHAADEPLLRTAVGDGQTTGGTVLIHRTPGNHGEHPVSVTFGVAQPLEHQDAAALTAYVTVGGGVEGLASPDR
ncbi:Uncharacterised protein [Mycobacteroides abscessus subsp. massiliense]|nr:Uncharacterised protein [Mycobacteroides abscessus subsp. massiliense]